MINILSGIVLTLLAVLFWMILAFDFDFTEEE